MLAAVKPTVGRISRYGIIPITADQDTAGPMAKSVMDTAIMLGVLESASPDPNDPATRACPPPAGRDYTRLLRVDSLKGARIGVPRANFYTRLGAEASALMTEAIAILSRQGATIVDPADIPSVVDPDPQDNILSWSTCSGAEQNRGRDENCSSVLKYGMKRDFNKWLASLGPAAPVKSLAELIAWNSAHKEAGALKYGQVNLEISDEMDVERDRAKYERDRAKDVALSATHGIDEIMKAQRLDAILFPASSGSAIAAKAGYPSVIVPLGFIASTASMPPGFNVKPQPYGVTFTGMACSEPRLLALAYAFEQATKRRVPPPGAP
jgi:amidase